MVYGLCFETYGSGPIDLGPIDLDLCGSKLLVKLLIEQQGLEPNSQ